MKTILIVLIAVVAAVVVMKWASKPMIHKNIKLDGLPKYMASLMAQCTDGSILFISIPNTDKFLQFAKYIDITKERLAFGFPDAPWSRDYVNELEKIFNAKGIEYEIEQTGREDTRAFLNIHDIKDIEEAQTIASSAMKAIGEGYNSRFSVHIEGGINKEIYERNKGKYEKYF